MTARPDVARGLHKGSRDELTQFWRMAKSQLNLIGPPVKSVSEWRKVWADQKKYVRQKAAQYLRARKGRGGGPNLEHHFSVIEEGIYNLIAVKESVKCASVKTFGLNSSSTMASGKDDRRPAIPSTSTALDAIVDDEHDEEFLQEPVATEKLPKTRRSTLDSLHEQFEIQKELSENIRGAVVELKDLHQSNNQIHRSLDKMCALQNRHFKQIAKLKQEEVDEMQRHNLIIEKLRQREVEDKIERNRRLLEIEELKWKATS